MIYRRLQTYLVFSTAFVFILFSGCDLFGSDDEEDPAVDEVVIVGTEVDSDFKNTGEFGLSATPLDPGGSAILSEDLDSEVSIQHTSSSSQSAQVESHDIQASVVVNRTRQPSGDPLAVPLSLDGSGSMTGNDPDRLRVDGAKEFIDQLEQGSATYEAGIYEFSGFSSNTDPDFNYTRVLQDFIDNPDSLKTASEGVEASGGTPMYGSLAEVLAYSENERPTANYEKAIVLFADGRPTGSDVTRDSVCTSSNEKESPIYGIGLGPASDISDSPDPAAVAEMRSISNCTNGSYQGLVEDSLEVIQQAFSAAATGTSQGSVSFSVQIDSGLDQLQAGEVVEGSLSVTSGGQTAEGRFSFRIPDPASSTSQKYHFPTVH